MLGEALLLLAIIGFAAVVVEVVAQGEAWLDRLTRAGRAVHLLRPPAPKPTGPPIAVLCADLRRLRHETLHPEPGRPALRRVAALAAYDDALGDACAALGLPDSLSTLPPGTDRDAERLRVEWLLHQQGLDVA